MPSIRYLNVGAVFNADGSSTHFDLELTNQTKYTPYDSALNVVSNGRFAQINLASNTEVRLRVTILLSCASAPSCVACEDPLLSEAGAITCFAAGCACYGTTVYRQVDCTGPTAAAKRAAYTCDRMSTRLVLPSEAMVSMTVYDFDTGPNGDYLEQLTVPEYAHYVTPLRASVGSGAADTLASTIFVNEATRMFTSTARGSSANNPTDPTALTADQAARGVQFFFKPDDGFVEATFSVSYTGAGTGTGRNLLFAGDSSLCAPPPPMLPALPPPPSSPPPSPPPFPPLADRATCSELLFDSIAILDARIRSLEQSVSFATDFLTHSGESSDECRPASTSRCPSTFEGPPAVQVTGRRLFHETLPLAQRHPLSYTRAELATLPCLPPQVRPARNQRI